MSPLCTLSLVGILAGVPFAGLSQDVQRSVYVSRVFTRTDTIQALHDICRNGRRWGQVISALAPVAAGVAIYSSPRMDLGIDIWGTSTSKPNGYATAFMLAIPATITFSLVGPLSWIGNSKAVEQETIRNYESHLPLSRRMQRRLHHRLESTLITTAPQTDK